VSTLSPPLPSSYYTDGGGVGVWTTHFWPGATHWTQLRDSYVPLPPPHSSLTIPPPLSHSALLIKSASEAPRSPVASESSKRPHSADSGPSSKRSKLSESSNAPTAYGQPQVKQEIKSEAGQEGRS
jgi:hypothetical protein